MKVIIYKMDDGTIKIGRIQLSDGRFTDGIRLLLSMDVSEDVAIDVIANKDKPVGCISWRVADSMELPESDGINYDKTFIKAFNHDLQLDIIKARQIQMDKIRLKRSEKFIEMGFPTRLDKDLETAILPKETIDKLQALRDIPQTFDLSTFETLADLKTAWPIELQGD